MIFLAVLALFASAITAREEGPEPTSKCYTISNWKGYNGRVLPRTTFTHEFPVVTVHSTSTQWITYTKTPIAHTLVTVSSTVSKTITKPTRELFLFDDMMRLRWTSERRLTSPQQATDTVTTTTTISSTVSKSTTVTVTSTQSDSTTTTSTATSTTTVPAPAGFTPIYDSSGERSYQPGKKRREVTNRLMKKSPPSCRPHETGNGNKPALVRCVVTSRPTATIPYVKTRKTTIFAPTSTSTYYKTVSNRLHPNALYPNALCTSARVSDGEAGLFSEHWLIDRL